MHNTIHREAHVTLVQHQSKMLYRQSKLTVHKDTEIRLDLSKLIGEVKLSYYNEKTLNGCPNQKSLFKFTDKHLHQEIEDTARFPL